MTIDFHETEDGVCTICKEWASVRWEITFAGTQTVTDDGYPEECCAVCKKVIGKSPGVFFVRKVSK